MSDKCKLYYDSNCPICCNYVTILKRKISISQITFIPSTTPMDEFKFVLEDGTEYIGKAGIEMMARRFPVIMDYFWMLPEKFRINGLQAVYKAGGVVRNVLKKVGGCNCGR